MKHVGFIHPHPCQRQTGQVPEVTSSPVESGAHLRGVRRGMGNWLLSCLCLLWQTLPLSRRRSWRALPTSLYLEGALKHRLDMCANHTWNSADASAGGLNHLPRARDCSEVWEAACGRRFIPQSGVQSKGSHMAQRWNSCLPRRNNSAASAICVNYETCNFHSHVAATHRHSCQGLGDGERWTVPVLWALAHHTAIHPQKP